MRYRRPIVSVEIRFRSRIKKTNDCWLWTGSRSRAGYGVIRDCQHNGGKLLYAHRLSLFYFKGINADKFHVLHKCDNPPCVNPEHLFLGDQRINNLDRDKKKRSKGREKLPQNLVKNVRILRNNKMTYKEIAETLKIRIPQIVGIINNYHKDLVWNKKVKPFKPKYSFASINQARELRKKGLSYPEIQRITGIKANYIPDILYRGARLER